MLLSVCLITKNEERFLGRGPRALDPLARAALIRGDRTSALKRLKAAVKHDPTWRAPRELLAEISVQGRA